MKRVHVIYRHEAGSWSAESPDVPGYTAVAETLTELRGLVREGLPFFLDEPIFIDEAGFFAGATVGGVAAFSAVSTSSVIGNLKSTQNDAAVGVALKHASKVAVS